jgi:two-component system, OmpR family, phosphate regulon response regulator PhoB
MKEAREGIAHPGSTPRILVVEDEPDLALLLAYNLEAEGYVAERRARR